VKKPTQSQVTLTGYTPLLDSVAQQAAFSFFPKGNRLIKCAKLASNRTALGYGAVSGRLNPDDDMTARDGPTFVTSRKR
jgi:hypothetical protein